MPWSVGDVDRFKKGLSPKAKRQWVAVANSALSDCLKKGGSPQSCEGKAIRMANGVTEAANPGVVYFGHTQDIINHNIEVLKQQGYEPSVARNIAHQIAGEPMPSEEPPREETPPEPEASATDSTDQTA